MALMACGRLFENGVIVEVQQRLMRQPVGIVQGESCEMANELVGLPKICIRLWFGEQFSTKGLQGLAPAVHKFLNGFLSMLSVSDHNLEHVTLCPVKPLDLVLGNVPARGAPQEDW